MGERKRIKNAAIVGDSCAVFLSGCERDGKPEREQESECQKRSKNILDTNGSHRASAHGEECAKTEKGRGKKSTELIASQGQNWREVGVERGREWSQEELGAYG